VSRYVNFEEILTSRISQESLAVTKDEEHQSPKDGQQSTIKTLGGEEEFSPSRPIMRPMWLLQILRDASEAPRSVARECRSLRKFLNYMVLMSSIIDVEPSIFEEATYQKVWQDAMI
jgi:hypothetical protein